MESDQIPSENVQAALNSLASCVRCRERRVGCDRQLPRCQACVAVGKECVQNDSFTQERIPRSHLQALHLRLQHLEAIEARVAPQLEARPTAADATCHSKPTSFLASDSPNFSEISTAAVGSSHSPHFPQERTKARNDFTNEWGPSSAVKHLRLIGTLLNVHITRPFHEVVQFHVPMAWAPQFPAGDARSQLPPIETAKFLMEFYYQCVDKFLPILGRADGDRDLERLYAGIGSPKSYRSCTRAQLALAIAARCLFRAQGKAGQSREYLELSGSMFESAMDSLKIVFQDSNALLEHVSSSAFENEEAHAIAKLQIVLLMVDYILCVPSKGNIWQLLGFAERLWQGIKNARAQLRRIKIEASQLSREQLKSRLKPTCLLYTSFTSLERMVGMAYGRPIDFPDLTEDDEPSYGTDDRNVPALHAQMLVMRQQVHSAFLSCTGPQESRRGILSSIDQIPSPGSLEWYSTIRSRAEDWFKRWQEMVQHMGERHKEFLLLTGAKFRDETLHLAFCLLLQKTADLGSGNEAVQGGPVESPSFADSFRFARRPHTVLPPDLLAEGRGIVRRLTSHLTYLLRHAFYTSNPPSLKDVPLVFPRTWIADIEVFRVGVTAAFLSRCPPSIDEKSGGRQRGREMDLTWEVAACIKLLSETSAEVNTEGLTEAILALVRNDGDSTVI